jgi:hypothetical protein
VYLSLVPAVEGGQIDDGPHLNVTLAQLELVPLLRHTVVLNLIALLQLRPHIRP